MEHNKIKGKGRRKNEVSERKKYDGRETEQKSRKEKKRGEEKRNRR